MFPFGAIPSPSWRGSGWEWRLPVLILVCALTAALAVGTASANGSVRLVVIDEVAGPYQLRVGILPADPIAGPLHVSIRILKADGDRSPVEDATVRVSLSGAGTPGETDAVSSPQDLSLYEGNLWLDALGDWRVTLDIDSPAGPATHAFNVRAREEGGFNLMFVIVAVAAVLVIASLFWSQLQRRRRITRGRR